MKILIVGTHFTPAVATIEQLKKYPDTQIIYVGRKSTQEGDPALSQESRTLPKLGVKFTPLVMGRLQRAFTIYTIPSLLKIPIGFLQAFFIILAEKPEVILSFGGYVAVPLVVVGWLFSIPIIVHEQTLMSGLANKISFLFADKIALSFKQAGANRDKTIVTGNPLRTMIVSGDSRAVKKNNLPVVLITGGNQGSHTINVTVEESIKRLTKFACVIHVTGENKFGDFERLEKLTEDRYQVLKWIGKEYGGLLQKVDLVVSRAGINTLTELAFLGKPALVIPLEPLYGDEQNKNAKYFAKLGLVKILPQDKLTGQSLFNNIKGMLNNSKFLNKQAKIAKEVIIPDSAKRLALETILLADSYR